MHRREVDPVEIPLLNTVRVHEDEATDPEANKLFDQRTARARAAHDGDGHPPQHLRRSSPESLRVAKHVLRERVVLVEMPQPKVVSNCAHDVDRIEATVLAHNASEHASAR